MVRPLFIYRPPLLASVSLLSTMTGAIGTSGSLAEVVFCAWSSLLGSSDTESSTLSSSRCLNPRRNLFKDSWGEWIDVVGEESEMDRWEILSIACYRVTERAVEKEPGHIDGVIGGGELRRLRKAGDKDWES